MDDIETFERPKTEVEALNDLLKSDPQKGPEIECRKGTTDDVFESAPNIKTSEETTATTTVCADEANYTQEEFEKEFFDDSVAIDYDSDPRKVATFDIIERVDATVEQSAGTISSMDVFAAKNSNSYVVRVNLANEDPKTIDVEVECDHFVMYSHQYKLKAYFPRRVEKETASTKFYTDKNTLEIIARSCY